MIWYGSNIEDICHEDTFRSLVDLAFTLEPGSLFKMSFNALLCSLCNVRPQHFSLLLMSCKDILTCEGSQVGRRLNTLACAAQSFHCTQMLLGSELAAQMVSRLTNGFEKLLELTYHPPSVSGNDAAKENLASDVRAIVLCLSNLLAFLTDFLRNWRPGKEWMASTDSHRFWFPMMEFLSINTTIVSSLEIAFIQEVSYEFFSVCLAQCSQAKMLFAQLMCSSLQNQRFGSDAGPTTTPILTPYVHKLLVGLVFQPESIPVILKFIPPEGSRINSLSLSSTYDVLEFHPSYPIDHMCYYMHVPGSFTLAQFEALVKGHTVTKSSIKAATEAKKPDKTLHRKTSLYGGKATSSTKIPLVKPPSSSATAAADAGAFSIDISSFKIRNWKILTKEAGKDSEDKATLSCSCLDLEGIEASNGKLIYRNFIKMYESQGGGKRTEVEVTMLCDIIPLGHNYPVVVIMDGKSMYFAAERLGAREMDMFNMFDSCHGLAPLARSIPPLYPHFWPSPATLGCRPCQLSDAAKKQLFKSHIVLGPTSTTPFRSIVILGLSLQLEGVGRVMGENPPVANMLMKLLLGEDASVKGQFINVDTNKFFSSLFPLARNHPQGGCRVH